MRRGNYFSSDLLTDENLERVRALNEIAKRRGQSLAQLAIAWVLRDERVTSALVGASSVSQLEQNVAALERADFDAARARGDRPLRGRRRAQHLGRSPATRSCTAPAAAGATA